MIGLCILAGILLLIVLLLCSSGALFVSCENGEFKLEARYLFLKFPIPFQKAEEKAKGTGKKTAPEKEKKQEQKEKAPLSESVSRIWELISAFARDVGILLSKLRFYDLTLRVTVCGEDAADTGIRYGKLCAYVYSGLGALQGLVKLRRVGKIQLTPDFSDCGTPTEEPRTDYFFSFVLKLRVASVLRTVLSGFFKYLRHLLKKQKDEARPAPAKNSAKPASR